MIVLSNINYFDFDIDKNVFILNMKKVEFSCGYLNEIQKDIQHNTYKILFNVQFLKHVDLAY